MGTTEVIAELTYQEPMTPSEIAYMQKLGIFRISETYRDRVTGIREGKARRIWFEL